MVQKYIKTAVKRARARHHVSQCFYFTMVCLITKIPPKLLIFNRNSCPGNSTKGPGRKFQKNKHSGEKTLKKSHFTIKRAKRAAFILTNVWIFALKIEKYETFLVILKHCEAGRMAKKKSRRAKKKRLTLCVVCTCTNSRNWDDDDSLYEQHWKGDF